MDLWRERAEAAGTPPSHSLERGPLFRTFWEARYPSWGPETENDEIHRSPREEGHGRLSEGVFSVMGDTLNPARDGQARCTDHIVSHMDGHTRHPEKGAAGVGEGLQEEAAKG